MTAPTHMSLEIRELLPYSDESIMLPCSALGDWSGYGISTPLLVLVLSFPFHPKALTSLEELMFSEVMAKAGGRELIAHGNSSLPR